MPPGHGLDHREHAERLLRQGAADEVISRPGRCRPIIATRWPPVSPTCWAVRPRTGGRHYRRPSSLRQMAADELAEPSDPAMVARGGRQATYLSEGMYPIAVPPIGSDPRSRVNIRWTSGYSQPSRPRRRRGRTTRPASVAGRRRSSTDRLAACRHPRSSGSPLKPLTISMARSCAPSRSPRRDAHLIDRRHHALDAEKGRQAHFSAFAMSREPLSALQTVLPRPWSHATAPSDHVLMKARPTLARDCGDGISHAKTGARRSRHGVRRPGTYGCA